MQEKIEHPNLSKINSRLQGQGQDPETDAHIATCQRCHSLYMGLKSLEPSLAQAFKGREEAVASSSCPLDWQLALAVKGELPPGEAQELSSHINNCEFCLHRAATYFKALGREKTPLKAPAAWRKAAFGIMTTEETRQEEKPLDNQVPFLRKIYSFVEKLSATLPPLPGYAAAALALVALLALYVMPVDKSTVITLASTERVTVRDLEAPSSFSFSGNFSGSSSGDEVIQEPGAMGISIKGTKAVFKWDPIEGASGDEFYLYDERGYEKLHQVSINNNPTVSVDLAMVQIKRRYVWLIKGETADGRYFEYSGDFVRVKR